MDLSIIIVNWNSKNYLRKCIASILETTIGIEYEIVVIDSGSYDGCGEMLRRNYPFIRFIQSDINLGFAKANNEAFKVSCGVNLLFINPDTEVKTGAVHSLLRQLRILPQVAIVGPRVLNTDGSIQTTCIRKLPTILNQVFMADAFKIWFPRWGLLGIAPLFVTVKTPKEVESVSGACLMIKRSAFERIGRFSTDYFMYSEDIDLCYKVQKAGCKIYYVPTAVVIHHGAGSSSKDDLNMFSSIMMIESRWRYFKKIRSAGYATFYRLAIFAAAMARISIMLITWPALTLFRRQASIGTPLRKWIAIMRWTLGLEKWIENY